MFDFLDLGLKSLSDFLSNGLTIILRTVFKLFNLNQGFLDSSQYINSVSFFFMILPKFL